LSVRNLMVLVPYLMAVSVGGQGFTRRGLWTGTIANSAIFYLATNSASWWQDAVYSKDVVGYIQCMTLGTPGYPPTFLFGLASLTSDITFTLAVVSVVAWVQKKDNAAVLV